MTAQINQGLKPQDSVLELVIQIERSGGILAQKFRLVHNRAQNLRAAKINHPANLRFAAFERAVGRSVLAVTSDEPKEVKLARSNKIMLLAGNVHDLDSFNEFMRTLQTEVDTAKPSETDALIRAGEVADWLWWIYVVLYAIGSVLLLRSQYVE